MKMLNSRVIKLGLMLVGLGVASAALAQSVREQQIAERLQPVGSVCLAGEACAAGGSAPVAQTATAAFSAEGTYEQYCAMCHNTGMANAPRRDDTAHWTARVEEAGLNAIVTNAINGINAMPPRGMCATCTDEQIGEVVQYLSGASAE